MADENEAAWQRQEFERQEEDVIYDPYADRSTNKSGAGTTLFGSKSGAGTTSLDSNPGRDHRLLRSLYEVSYERTWRFAAPAARELASRERGREGVFTSSRLLYLSRLLPLFPHV
jgi:hypothetical protein